MLELACLCPVVRVWPRRYANRGSKIASPMNTRNVMLRSAVCEGVLLHEVCRLLLIYVQIPRRVWSTRYICIEPITLNNRRSPAPALRGTLPRNLAKIRRHSQPDCFFTPFLFSSAAYASFPPYADAMAEVLRAGVYFWPRTSLLEFVHDWAWAASICRSLRYLLIAQSPIQPAEQCSRRYSPTFEPRPQASFVLLPSIRVLGYTKFLPLVWGGRRNSYRT